MKQVHTVELSEVERAQLLLRVRLGTSGARRLRRARTLLVADEDKPDAEIVVRLLGQGVEDLILVQRGNASRLVVGQGSFH